MTATTARKSPTASAAQPKPAKPLKLSVKPVTAARWPDFESLFESKGAPKYCWCMAWRANAEERKSTTNDARKKAMKLRVDAGTPIGLLGYVDGKPAQRGL